MTPHAREPSPDPLLLAIDMGYGHLRAAWALAEELGVPVMRIDAKPVGLDLDVRTWARVRRIYEMLSRSYGHRGLGVLARRFLDATTSIPPLRPGRVNPSPTRAVRFQAKMIRKGMGKEIAGRMREEGVRMVTTFYTPGLVADYAGLDHGYVVVTDADAHRVWAPMHPARTRVTYFAPSRRVLERLRFYGVPEERILLSGFPLPLSLVGDESGDVLRKNLGPRLVRLALDATLRREVEASGELNLPASYEGAPPHLLLAIGGAGAQTEFVHTMLTRLRDMVRERRLRLTLVAGLRPAVAQMFHRYVHDVGLVDHPGVTVLEEDDFESYYRRFNETLADVDVIWTKPSEMVFYAGLGIPLVLAPPVGAHERYNPVFVGDAGAAVAQGPPSEAASWLPPLLESGSMARCAWNAFRRLPNQGTRRIVTRLREDMT
jgi:hypothetical protein